MDWRNYKLIPQIRKASSKISVRCGKKESIVIIIIIITIIGIFFHCDPTRVMTFSFLRFLDHTQRRTRVGRTPLDE